MAERNVIEYLFRGKDEVSGTIDRVSSAFGTAVKAATALGLGYAAIKVGQFVKEQIDVVDELGKMSQKSGVAVESLSRLQHAFLLNEVDANELSNAFKFLSRSIESAASGNKSAEAAFSSLGLSLSDIKNSSPDEVLLKIADAFSKSEDGSAKAAIAMKLFGRAGVDMIPALNEGRAGISKLTEEADRLGLTVSKEFSREADEFNDSITRIQQGTAGAGRSVAKALLPVLNETMDALGNMFATTENAVPWGKIIAIAAAAIATALIGIIGAAKQVYIVVSSTFEALGTSIGGLLAAVTTAAGGDLREAFDILKQSSSDAGSVMVKMAEDIVKVNKEAHDGITQIWEGLGRLEDGVDSVSEATSEANKNKLNIVDPEAVEALEKLRAKQQEFLTSLEQSEAASRDDRLALLKSEYNARLSQMDALGLQGADLARAEVALESWVSQEKLNIRRSMLDQLGIADAEYRAMTEQLASEQSQRMIEAGLTEAQADRYLKTTLLEQQLAFHEARRTAIGEDNLTNAEIALLNYEEEHLQLQLALERQLITREQFAAAEYSLEVNKQAALGSLHAAAEKNRLMVSKMTADQQLAYTSQSLNSLSALMQTQNEKQFKIGKAAAIAQAVINTYQAATAAFASASAIPIVGWILGPIAAAAAVALGIANVNKIKSTQFQGQAHDGMTNVPSEGTYLLDKGERVLSPSQNNDLTKFLSNGGDESETASSGIGQVVININVPTGEALRSMSKRDWEDLVSDRVIPAINALDKKGVRPDSIQRAQR